MNWRNYRVTAGNFTTYVRAISPRDARYVATMPCKRNGRKPVFSPSMCLTIELED